MFSYTSRNVWQSFMQVDIALTTLTVIINIERSSHSCYICPCQIREGFKNCYLPLLSESALSSFVSSILSLLGAATGFYVVPLHLSFNFLYFVTRCYTSPTLFLSSSLLRKIEDHQITTEERNCKAYQMLFYLIMLSILVLIYILNTNILLYTNIIKNAAKLLNCMCQ